MIEHELILLGLLKENPKHGYEIKKDIKTILSLFAGINPKSTYYPLRVLEKKGLVIKTVEKSGRRPARYVYQLTSKGEGRFNSLLRKSFLDFKRPEFSIDLSLYFLEYMKPDMAKRRLRARIFILKKLSKSLKHMLKNLTGRNQSAVFMILSHNLQMLEAESQFLTNLNKTFLKEGYLC